MKIKQQSKCRKNIYQREIDLPLLAQDYIMSLKTRNKLNKKKGN